MRKQTKKVTAITNRKRNNAITRIEDEIYSIECKMNACLDSTERAYFTRKMQSEDEIEEFFSLGRQLLLKKHLLSRIKRNIDVDSFFE